MARTWISLSGYWLRNNVNVSHDHIGRLIQGYGSRQLVVSLGGGKAHEALNGRITRKGVSGIYSSREAS